MSQFRFTCRHGDGDRYTEVQCEAEHIDEVIENFEEFLRGCGYYFSGQITRFDPEPKAAEQIRVDEVVGQSYEGHDW